MSDVSTTALDPTTGLPVVTTAPVAPVAPVTATTAPPTPIAPVAPSSPAPAAVETAPAPATDLTALLAEIQSLRSEIQAAKPAAPAVEVPANPPSPTNLFTKGQIVRFAWDDPYDGPSEKFGLVIDTLPDEGAGARSRLAWFGGGASGPIGDHTLTAV
jgi:hypothetical protein